MSLYLLIDVEMIDLFGNMMTPAVTYILPPLQLLNGSEPWCSRLLAKSIRLCFAYLSPFQRARVFDKGY